MSRKRKYLERTLAEIVKEAGVAGGSLGPDLPIDYSKNWLEMIVGKEEAAQARKPAAPAAARVDWMAAIGRK